jgi:predicted phage terminase large subunit-like protein
MPRYAVPSIPATQNQKLADTLLMIAEAEEMRRDLKQFVIGAWKYVDPAPFIGSWYLDAICEHLTALSLGKIRFLLINIPPRHSKSTICSVIWPVWGWLQKPDERFLSASYSLDLATRDNLKKRNLIDSQWFQERYGQSFTLATDTGLMEFTREPDFDLSKEQNAKRFFMNDKLGYQMVTSVAASATGHGGSVLIIDDAHAADEAYGSADRDAATRWFRETWSNRMNDANHDKMMVIGQRIHEEDVSGIILSERPDWVHLNLPAEFEPARKCFTSIGWEDPRTKEGELLCPERFNQETIARYKRDLGSIGYAAQYQQSPAPSGGTQFNKKWFRYFTETEEAYILETPEGTRSILKERCRIFSTVDLAISKKQTADFTVFSIWAVTPERDLVLIDMIRGHINNPDQLKQLRLLNLQYRGIYFKIESTAYQVALVQQALIEGVPCREYNTTGKGDKKARASMASIWMENGKIYFRKGVSYQNDMETELLLFPMAAHDDIVDTFSMAADDIVNPSGSMIWSMDDDGDTSMEQEVADGTQYPSVFQANHKSINEDEGNWFESGVDGWE